MHTTVIAGVGPGLGASLAWTFAAEGCAVALLARSPDYIHDLEAELRESGYDALAVQADVSDPEAVEGAFEQVRTTLGPVDTLVFNASAAPWKGLTSITDEEFDNALGVNVRGALYCSRAAVSDMLERAGGTVIFTGATTATRGRKGALGFSAAKFAARGMAESMAKELGPEGVHVAHVVIDGQILTPSARQQQPSRDADSFLDPDAIAREYWRLVEQDRTAWTLELDLRPSVEAF